MTIGSEDCHLTSIFEKGVPRPAKGKGLFSIANASIFGAVRLFAYTDLRPCILFSVK